MSEAPVLNQRHILPEDRASNMTFMDPIEPDWDAWRVIADAAGADIDCCWSCGACDNECPVNLATGRLRPQRNVRMAVYGMLDQLLALPDIWYCLSCRRSLQGCPNRVKPYELHRYLQHEALQRGIYTYDFLSRYCADCAPNSSAFAGALWRIASRVN